MRLDCIFNTRWKQDGHHVEKGEGGCRNVRGTPPATNDWVISSYKLKGHTFQGRIDHSRTCLGLYLVHPVRYIVYPLKTPAVTSRTSTFNIHELYILPIKCNFVPHNSHKKNKTVIISLCTINLLIFVMYKQCVLFEY